MASLRKASAYSKKKARPYTRKSAKRRRAYIKTVPASKIVKFNMGNQRDYNEGKHPFVLKLIATDGVQMRDNSLEACRLLLFKILEKGIPGDYSLTIKVYPHHILRENKTAAGAGADRLSSGMKHSFGVTVGRAAIVPAGKELFMVSCANERAVKIAREALNKAKPKVPCKTKIVFEKAE
jgi:large subunit ribosomal protein L10e